MKFYLTIILLLKIHMAEAQIKLEKGFIYNYFPERGFTTAGLSSELKQIKQDRREQIPLSIQDIQILHTVMEDSKVKRHFQTKTGGGALFGELQLNSKTIDIIVFNNLIFDITNHVNYWVRDKKNQEILSEWISQIKDRGNQ